MAKMPRNRRAIASPRRAAVEKPVTRVADTANAYRSYKSYRSHTHSPHLPRLFRRALALLLLALPLAAHGASFEERLEQAHGHLRSGDATRALELYRELQVDFPDEDRIIFGMGCAQYDQAAALVTQPPPPGPEEGEAPAPAVAQFEEAAATFDRVSMSRDLNLRADARFNRGNCATAKAKFLADQSKRDEAIKAYRRAIDIYEQTLQDAPDHAGARQNLDHARYELKKLLQQPEEEPPEQPDPVSLFTVYSTEIPDAQVVVPEDGPSQVELLQGEGESES